MRWPPPFRALVALMLLGCGPAHSEGGSVATVSASVSAAPPTSVSAAPPAACWKTGSCPAVAGAAFTSDAPVDIHIAGGTVVDGSGKPPVLADVLIDEGRIVHVGPVARVTAAQTIDAKGKVVTPGFIDAHGHGNPEHPSGNYLAMGVTTVCIGQDGKSPSDDRIRYWKGRIAKRRLAVNIVPFVGHGTVRGDAGVGIAPVPTDKQLDRMAREVAQGMDGGAWGLSTGLEYQPGSFASEAELVAIAKPVAERDGVVMSHLRSEDDDAIDGAIAELVAQGKGSGARVHVSHIKVVYGKGVERAERLLATLDAARGSGVKITADIYPYEASYTTINIVFPDFALPPHSYKRVKQERRADLEAFLRDKVTRRGGPEATLFGTNPWRGMTLAAVAKKLGKPFEDVLIDDIGTGKAAAAFFVMDEPLQSRLLLDPHVMIGTDGGPTSRHPRGYGTFAKVIRVHVVERAALSLEEAIRKMTALPADTIGLSRDKRGMLQPGWAADVLVFDPRKVKDRATYDDPNVSAEGIAWALVNGVPAIADGKLKKTRGGRLLLRPSN